MVMTGLLFSIIIDEVIPIFFHGCYHNIAQLFKDVLFILVGYLENLDETYYNDL